MVGLGQCVHGGGRALSLCALHHRHHEGLRGSRHFTVPDADWLVIELHVQAFGRSTIALQQKVRPAVGRE